MKRIILFLCLLATLTACKQGKPSEANSQQAATDSSATQVATKNSNELPPRKAIYELKEVKEGWKSLNIPVDGTSESADIVELLKAFNKAWPTAIGNTLTLKGEGKNVPQENGYPNLKVKTDKAKGYMEGMGSNTGDAENMMASVVDRQNGHKLLLVCLAWPIANVDQFVCAYDFDPQAGLLTPEDSPAENFKGLLKKPYISFFLPQGNKEFAIEEDASLVLRHIYQFDGNNFKFAGIRIGEQDKLIELFKLDKAEDGNDPLTKWALIDIDQDGVNEIWMQADNGKNGAFFAFGDFEGPQLLVSETSRFRPSFAPGRITVGGPAGGPSYYTNTITVKDSQRAHDFKRMDVYEDAEYSIDDKDVSVEEGKAFEATLSRDLYDPKPEWHKLMK